MASSVAKTSVAIEVGFIKKGQRFGAAPVYSGRRSAMPDGVSTSCQIEPIRRLEGFDARPFLGPGSSVSAASRRQPGSQLRGTRAFRLVRKPAPRFARILHRPDLQDVLDRTVVATHIQAIRHIDGLRRRYG